MSGGGSRELRELAARVADLEKTVNRLTSGVYDGQRRLDALEAAAKPKSKRPARATRKARGK